MNFATEASSLPEPYRQATGRVRQDCRKLDTPNEPVIWRKISPCSPPAQVHVGAAPLRSVLIGLGFFFMGSLSDVWLQHYVGSRSVAIMDDALVGIGVGLLVLLYERRQRQNMIRKLEVIRLMNHHVRNSLQVISFASSSPQQDELANKVRDAVERIEWALREVLPGQREDVSLLPFHPHSNQPADKPKSVA
jgi:hypothetical protein